MLARKNNSTLRQGEPMTDELECNLRATLCRQLAKREPANRVLWMDEAETWIHGKNDLRGIINSASGYECATSSRICSFKVCSPEPQAK